MKLNELSPAFGARKKVKRLGRGDATGHGGTSTRGHKGQKSRSGGFHKRGFEGGQMPLQRRIPKHGFTNVFKREFEIINVDQLNDFAAGSKIDAKTLFEKGLIKKPDSEVKVLGRGELKNSLVISAKKVSKQAKEKIEKAGGKIIASEELA